MTLSAKRKSEQALIKLQHDAQHKKKRKLFVDDFKDVMLYHSNNFTNYLEAGLSMSK